MIQMVMTFVKYVRFSSPYTSDVYRVVKSNNTFPSMHARLLKTRKKKPKPTVSFRTKRQGPTFSNFDIPKLPDNNEVQMFIVYNRGNKSIHFPSKGQLISEFPFDIKMGVHFLSASL